MEEPYKLDLYPKIMNHYRAQQLTIQNLKINIITL